MAGNPNWTKGKSGNPKGRPKKEQSFTRLLDELGAKKRPGAKATRDGELAERLWNMAIEGDMAALKYLIDRRFGRPKESHEITGAEGGPINIGVDWNL